MDRDDSRARGFLLRTTLRGQCLSKLGVADAGFWFYRLTEGEVARWTSEPATAQNFPTFEAADGARDAWGPSAPEVGVVPASDPFGRASYRAFRGGVRVE